MTKAPTDCAHPDDRLEVRKFRKPMGRWIVFRLQCLECLEPIGPDLDPLDLPDGLKIPDVEWAKRKLPKRGATGFGGKGNSKRREYQRSIRSSRFRKLARQVIVEADGRCADCGGEATTAAHLTYERLGRERLSDLKASCKACNDDERVERITRAVLGG